MIVTYMNMIYVGNQYYSWVQHIAHTDPSIFVRIIDSSRIVWCQSHITHRS